MTRRVSSLSPLVLVLAGLTSCALWPVSDSAYDYRVSASEPAVVLSNLARADDLYREPRDVTRVQQSLDLYLASISPYDRYAGLWGAMRACAWLAERHDDEDERARFAKMGVGLGPASISRSPLQPEPHYYYALCLGHLSAIESRDGGRVPGMADAAKRSIEIDDRFDRAAGHRFLGLLYLETESYPLIAIGTIDDALTHLERACELFPDAGDNQLSLARALIEDEEEDAARQRLLRVLSSPIPRDQTAEHGEWVDEAKTLLAELEND